jgi:hypothetical protein
MSNLEYALSYARRGWRVHPLHTPQAADGCSCGKPGCHSIGKHPWTRSGVRDATNDEATIRQWWGEHPDANIGLATGEASGVVVVDLDGPAGIDAFQSLSGDHGGEIGEPLIAATGGGGQHLFYAHEPGLRNRSKIDGKPIDLRADGGYVAAPPSLHRSGKRYEWIGGDDGRQPGKMPAWLLEFVKPKPIEAPKVTPAVSPSIGCDKIARAAAYLATVPSAISGSGGLSWERLRSSPIRPRKVMRQPILDLSRHGRFKACPASSAKWLPTTWRRRLDRNRNSPSAVR